ncbi:MAG: hypothetical protein AB7O60_03415 [Variibacter sp.]
MRQSYQRRLTALEAEYTSLLRDALRRCANGYWGLFAHNKTLFGRSRDDWADLSDLATEVERLRQRLGYADAFAPHERLLRMRGKRDSNTPGEPVLARQWLKELGSSAQD